jgi:aromatic ring hydroxylase
VGRGGTEFGGRHELYERDHSGSHEATRVELYGRQLADGTIGGHKAFVEHCLSEYDLDQLDGAGPPRLFHCAADDPGT